MLNQIAGEIVNMKILDIYDSSNEQSLKAYSFYHKKFILPLDI